MLDREAKKRKVYFGLEKKVKGMPPKGPEVRKPRSTWIRALDPSLPQ